METGNDQTMSGPNQCGDDGLPDKCWHTLITTTEYAEGVICLAQSLYLVGSCHPVACWVTDEALSKQVEGLARAEGIRSVPIMTRILPAQEPHALQPCGGSGMSSTGVPAAAAAAPTKEEEGAQPPLFRDATRRALWRRGKSFIFLDADMIVTQNIDHLFDLMIEDSAQPRVHAVPCFRIKKRAYGIDPSKDNFNAGLMVVVSPAPQDADAIAAGHGDIQQGWETNEEKVLNEVFRGCWEPLGPRYNASKRCFKHAPGLWDTEAPDMAVVHYVGGKPWQHVPRDWEDNGPYEALFGLWRDVRRQRIRTEPNGEAPGLSLAPLIPLSANCKT